MVERGSFVICAGGTGGHVFPALALYEELKKDGYEVAYISDTRGSKYLSTHKNLCLLILKIHPRRTSKDAFLFLLTLMLSVFQVMLKFIKNRPQAVIGFGGYPTLPGLVAAILLRIPIFLHEQNAVLGRVNRLMGGVARKVMLSFIKTRALSERIKKKTVVVGMPVREKIQELAEIRYEVPKNSQEKLNIIVLGGSQGAAVFDEMIPNAIKALPAGLQQKISLTQQCSAQQISRLRSVYESLGISAEVAVFFEDVSALLKKAHLVISRAGASSVAELQCAGRPAILIPFQKALDNHQYYNALHITERGGGWLLQEDDYTEKNMAVMIKSLLSHPKKLFWAAESMKTSLQKNAALHLKNIILEHSKNIRSFL